MHELPKYVQVYNKLLSMIKRSQFPPGSKLPSEEELTKDFSVSRVTLRLALSLLKEDGIINSIQGQGHFVNTDVDSDIKNGLMLFSNPLVESLVVPEESLLDTESYYFLNPSSLYTDKLFSAENESYYTLNTWYKYDSEYIANTFSIILPKTIKEVELDIDNNVQLVKFLENGIYDISMSSHIVTSISSRETDSFRKDFKTGDKLVLLTENLFGADGNLIAQSKHYILENYFKSSLIRYKDNYNNHVNR